MHHYVELKKMVHMDVKVKKQFKRKGTIRQSKSLGHSKPNWKSNTRGGPS
jgi:hypothetical protein